MRLNVFRGSFLTIFALAMPYGNAATYSDGFEAATINSFWQLAAGGTGTATIVNSPVHSGTQALQLAQSSTFPNYVGLVHDFGSDVQGSVSVWANNGNNPNAELAVADSAGNAA